MKFDKSINKNFFLVQEGKISKEILASDRVKKQSHDSIVREKIILICLIENPFLILKYAEKWEKFALMTLIYHPYISEILEFSASNRDKELENFDLKSYLLQRGLKKEIDYIFQPELLSTYRPIIINTKDKVESSFIGLLELHNNLLNKGDLEAALSDLEENMDEKSFENFMKIKNESLNKK